MVTAGGTDHLRINPCIALTKTVTLNGSKLDAGDIDQNTNGVFRTRQRGLSSARAPLVTDSKGLGDIHSLLYAATGALLGGFKR